MKSTPVGLATCSYGANGTECLLSTSFGRFELTIGSITAAHGFAQKRTPVRHGADGRWPLAGDRFGLHGANCGRARRPLLVARLHPAPTRRGIGFDGEQSPAAGVRDWFARGAIASRCGSEETTGCGGGPPARGLGRRGRPWGAHPNALGRAGQMPPCALRSQRHYAASPFRAMQVACLLRRDARRVAIAGDAAVASLRC